ncbi:hypothetical protein [Euzebya rosea]|uniref:hypothetical protein n=1 Tax=Euzebya rosea TaxID=2052804 RepID=UPI000D3ECB41|nr:hypothetical protein [Euzebya rosea]
MIALPGEGQGAGRPRPHDPERQAGRPRRHDPARAEEAGASVARRWVRRGVLVVGLLMGLVLVTSSFGRDDAGNARVPMRVDVATQDAVVDVLMLYSAEVDVADAAAAHVDPFGLPPLAVRARQLREATAALREGLVDLRIDQVAPNTPGQAYVDHPDHDALATVADEVATHAELLGFLGDVHDTLYGGAGAVGIPRARSLLDGQILPAGGPDAGMAWARGLLDAIDGRADASVVAAQRAAAGAEWTASANRLGPADGADLAAFLNGIDPGVLATLDGHPVAGPALQRLRG